MCGASPTIELSNRGHDARACLAVFLTLSLPRARADAVWSGVGTASATFIGKILFAEPLTRAKLLWTGLIVAGVVGLNFA